MRLQDYVLQTWSTSSIHFQTSVPHRMRIYLELCPTGKSGRWNKVLPPTTTKNYDLKTSCKRYEQISTSIFVFKVRSFEEKLCNEQIFEA